MEKKLIRLPTFLPPGLSTEQAREPHLSAPPLSPCCHFCPCVLSLSEVEMYLSVRCLPPRAQLTSSYHGPHLPEPQVQHHHRSIVITDHRHTARTTVWMHCRDGAVRGRLQTAALPGPSWACRPCSFPAASQTHTHSMWEVWPLDMNLYQRHPTRCKLPHPICWQDGID